jgi:hypothetical protein
MKSQFFPTNHHDPEGITHFKDFPISPSHAPLLPSILYHLQQGFHGPRQVVKFQKPPGAAKTQTCFR